MPRLVATYGDALLRAHRDLLAILRDLRAQVDPPTGHRGENLLPRLTAARSLIAEHFAFEEQNGYMTSVVDLQPHLTRAVDRLQQEHEELLATLDSLIAEVRVAGLSDDLRNRVGLWLKAIRRHELSENVLMQDAFSLDLGSKD